MEEEKTITIKIENNVGDTIEKLKEIKELLLTIKELSKEVFRSVKDSDTSKCNTQKPIGLTFTTEKKNFN